jgi:WD40 repeat protein
VTAADPGTFRVRDRATGAVLAEGRTSEPTHPDFFRVVLTPGGRQLVTSYIVDDDGVLNTRVQILDATTLQPVNGAPLQLEGLAISVSITPDGRQAVVGLGHPSTPIDAVVVDLRERRTIRSIPLEELDWTWSNTVGSDGRTVGPGDTSGRVVIVDARTGDKSPPIQAHDGFVESVSFAPDLATIVTAGRDGTVKLWDTGTRIARHRPSSGLEPDRASELRRPPRWPDRDEWVTEPDFWLIAGHPP